MEEDCTAQEIAAMGVSGTAVEIQRPAAGTAVPGAFEGGG